MAEERDGEGAAMASLVKKIISTAKAPAAMGPYRCAPAGGSGLYPVGGCGVVLGVVVGGYKGVIRWFWGGWICPWGWWGRWGPGTPKGSGSGMAPGASARPRAP